MSPFSALATPALPDDRRLLGNFGDLPLDILPIVLRSIAPDDRSTLLNLALVNKSAYLLTRPRREVLALVAEEGASTWRSGKIHIARRFQHATHLARSSDWTICIETVHALLSQWIEKVCTHAIHTPAYEQPMLKHMIETIQLLPAPQASQLLCKLLVAWHKMWEAHNVSVHELQGALELFKRAASGLPDDAREALVCACALVGSLQWKSNFERGAPGERDAEDAVLAQAGELLLASRLHWTRDGALGDSRLSPEALAMMLRIIALHLKRLPKPQRNALTLHALEAAATWPVQQRAALLKTLMRHLSSRGSLGPSIAASMHGHMLDLESMLAECATLSDDDKLAALTDLLYVVKCRDRLYHHGDDPDLKAAFESSLSRIGERFMEQLFNVTPSEKHRLALTDRMQLVMKTFYNWDHEHAQWTAGFMAVRKACAQRYGPGDTFPPTCLGAALFKHDNWRLVAARRAALAPLLAKDGGNAETGGHASTWRLYIDIIENCPEGANHPCGFDREIALRHAEALLAAAYDFPARAWADMMRQTLLLIDGTTDGYRIMHQVLLRAGTVPQEPRADLLERLSYRVTGWSPAYQSSGIDMLLHEVDALNERNKVRLLPRLIDIYLCSYPKNSDATLWLPAIMRLFTSLPDAHRRDALEAALDYETMTKADPAASVALLQELEQQVATLPAQQQAGLLLCMALSCGQIQHARSATLLHQMLERFDGLDLAPQAKQAWKLLYRAAYRHAGAWVDDGGLWENVSAECDALPDDSREATRAMLEYLERLPRYEKTKAAQSSRCVIS